MDVKTERRLLLSTLAFAAAGLLICLAHMLTVGTRNANWFVVGFFGTLAVLTLFWTGSFLSRRRAAYVQCPDCGGLLKKISVVYLAENAWCTYARCDVCKKAWEVPKRPL